MMSECYYSYSFELEDCLIMEENLTKTSLSPMQAVGLDVPLNFDDFIDAWKAVCFPIFENENDGEKLTCRYFKEAYARGEREIIVGLEHNPLKNTYAAKHTRVKVRLYDDEKTGHACANVMWEDVSGELLELEGLL